MSIQLTRRQVLQFVGGSALGMLFSPIPWKVLDDTAIWTQNWPWIPKAATGTFTYAGTTCTLCPSACGMRARSVGAQPVSVSGIAQHPFNNGALCTTGMLAHHMRYHPARLTQPMKFLAGVDAGTPLTSQSAWDEISRSLNTSNVPGSIVILDSRPGRTASSLFRNIGAKNPAVCYVPVSDPTLDVVRSMTDAVPSSLGYDIDRARLILNFGAPLFESWGSPSRAGKQYNVRASKTQTVIHVESLCSRSASRSDEWIAARPGSEAALALCLACVMIEEKLYTAAAAHAIADFAEFSKFVCTFTPEAVSHVAGVTPETLRNTARAFASQSPALAIADGGAPYETQCAVMALNLLAGNVGRTGGVARRNEIPDASALSSGKNSAPSALNLLAGNVGRTGGVARRNEIPDASALSSVKNVAASLHDVPDHSVRTLIIDESLSGCVLDESLLEKKLLLTGAVIISLSPFACARAYCTQYVLPASVMFETLTDVPGPIDIPVASLALSKAVLQAPEGTMDAVYFAQMLARALGTALPAFASSEELLKQRVAGLYESRRGTVFAPSTGACVALKQYASADELWTALANGGCWMDDEKFIDEVHYDSVATNDMSKGNEAIVGEAKDSIAQNSISKGNEAIVGEARNSVATNGMSKGNEAIVGEARNSVATNGMLKGNEATGGEARNSVATNGMLKGNVAIVGEAKNSVAQNSISKGNEAIVGAAKDSIATNSMSKGNEAIVGEARNSKTKLMKAPPSFSIMNVLRAAHVSLPVPQAMDQIFVVPFAETTTYDGQLISPLMSKVTQESGLRLSMCQAYVNPVTAQAYSIATGDTLRLMTKRGSTIVRVKLDASVMPNIVFVSVAITGTNGQKTRTAHDVRLLFDKNENGSFCSTPVSLQKVIA